MAISEPGDALWAEVSRLTAWPDSDEDAVRAMAAGWRDGGAHFTRASGFDLSPVATHWSDPAGQAFHGRTTEGLQAAATMGAGMTELAGRADAFAAEVTGVKNGIHQLMAANQAGFAQAAALPGDARAVFVEQVAGLVDTMKAEAAGRIAALPDPHGSDSDADKDALNRILRDYQVVEDPRPLEQWPEGPASIFGTRQVSPSEKEVLNRLLNIQLPRASYVIKEVEGRASEQFVDGEDGHQDAFRHVYLQARLTQEFGETWARDLGTAHEQGVSPVNGESNRPSREAMDLYNNEVGRAIGLQNPNASQDELAAYVRQAVETGHYTDDQGNRITARPVVNDGNGNLAYSDSVVIGQTGEAAAKPPLPGRDPSQVGRPGG